MCSPALFIFRTPTLPLSSGLRNVLFKCFTLRPAATHWLSSKNKCDLFGGFENCLVGWTALNRRWVISEAFLHGANYVKIELSKHINIKQDFFLSMMAILSGVLWRMEINLVLTQKSKISARITVGGVVINSASWIVNNALMLPFVSAILHSSYLLCVDFFLSFFLTVAYNRSINFRINGVP